MSLITRFLKPPSQSYFLLGPRGTGKSTYLRQTYPNALWIDFLHPQTERSYKAHPERLFEAVQAHPSKTIIIDEVQRVPAVLTAVHALIEQHKEWQFILTGSSSRKIKQSGIDLLAGRALRYSMHPFMAQELGASFDFQKALAQGLLPLVHRAKQPLETLQAYVSLYLKEEIQMEGLVRNLDDFSRFLETISFSHGSLLNITNIARECEVKRKTAEGYLSILEDLLLGYTIPVFSKRAKRQLSSHPKFYLFDAGVFRALRPRGPLDRSEEIEGAALEGLVVQHLIAWNDYNQQKHQIAFWRTRAGLEVDFIVYGPEVFWAIEVKNSQRLSKMDTKPLEAFLLDYPMAKAILLYRGEETLVQNQVHCMPCETFIRELTIPLIA